MAADKTADQPVLARITSQMSTSGLDASGRYVQGVRVSFKTAQGHMGNVFVPEAQYTPAHVKEMVREAAKNMDEIGSLEVR